MLRAAELTVVYYHTRPSGGSFYTILDDMGITRYYTGENIAMARPTAESVMYSWMNSSGHASNILNTNYQRIDIGVVYHNGLYYWTQVFDGLTTTNESMEYSIWQMFSLGVLLLEDGQHIPDYGVEVFCIPGTPADKQAVDVPNTNKLRCVLVINAPAIQQRDGCRNLFSI